MFTEKDLEQFTTKGIDVALVEEQIKNFQQGFPFLNLNRAATINDGIKKAEGSEADKYQKFFEDNLADLTITKFVPASGAATRMFKALFAFMKNYKGTEEEYKKFSSDQGFQSVYNFFKNLDKFAFYSDLKEAYKKACGEEIAKALEEKKYVSILEVLLTDKGLQYGDLPKGLLYFHKYEEGSRTPVEEHMVEAAVYGKDKNDVANLHFTVSPEHRSRFEKLIADVKEKYEKKYNVSYNISFSEQRTATDTIAVDMYNLPFRDEEGVILFRPAGHGALIYNLDDIEDDLIFIKNIDNVVPDKIKDETYRYKKVIAGVLLQYREKVFDYIKKLEGPDADKYVDEISEFVEKELCVEPGTLDGEIDKKEFLLTKLNRPIRVCGMVKNEGEPGGGPFWARNPDGTISLQVVESAQVDTDDPAQMDTFKKATHFNPVDLVCSVKSHTGAKFSLEMFRDPETGFISQKSKDGRDLKAQELPGLWNGSMADWTTIFVEVPAITFNPVKTVNDLLRDEHQ